MRTADDIFAKCERDGEETVRKRLAQKNYCTHDEIPIVEEWLRHKDEERAIATASKRDKREEETLSIAKEANRIARRANINAIIAMILSAIIALAMIIIQLSTKK
ncbi:MAG: hypothetical protein AABW61_02400 [Candidatus Aenigmatarchaeota archaeon]